MGAAACTPRRAAEAVALGQEVRREADIPFGVHPRQRLDVYHPRRRSAPAPVIVFVYGGRWKYGDRRDWLLLASRLARRGWVVVVPGYRLYPEVLFPAWVEDGARAVRWAADHAAAFGGDPARIIIVGHSSGGHTVALLGLDERWLRDAGVPAGAVRGVAALAAPVDTAWTARDVQRLMGPASGWPATYPATHVDGREPPLLLLHGEADDVVTPGSSVRLAERVRARGGCVRLVLYPRIDHVEIALALAFPSLALAPVQRELERFVRDPAGRACPARG